MLARGNTTQKHNTITETKSQTTSGVSSEYTNENFELDNLFRIATKCDALHSFLSPQTILQFSQMIASEKPV